MQIKRSRVKAELLVFPLDLVGVPGRAAEAFPSDGPMQAPFALAPDLPQADPGGETVPSASGAMPWSGATDATPLAAAPSVLAPAHDDPGSPSRSLAEAGEGGTREMVAQTLDLSTVTARQTPAPDPLLPREDPEPDSTAVSAAPEAPSASAVVWPTGEPGPDVLAQSRTLPPPDPTQASGPGLAQFLTDINPGAQVDFTGDRNVDAVLIGARWSISNLTYSFPASGSF